MTSKSPLRFAEPTIGDAEIQSVVETLSSGWLTTGPKAQQFEEEFAAAVGASHALAVNSATSGLHLALDAIGVGPGDKVITSPFTFTASAEVMRYLGADPVFADIDPLTFNVDPYAIEAVYAEHRRDVKALMPVHIAGQACDMDPIIQFGEKNGLRIVEDAAHAFPANYNGRSIGSLGDVTVFSFYATKTITTGEGGMVTTEDADFAERIRTMRLHGIDRAVFDRYQSDRPKWYYEIIAPGFKYNMPDLCAAIGLAQLRQAESFRKRREEIASAYSAGFADLPMRTPKVSNPQDVHAWHLYIILLELEQLSIGRDRFIEELASEGIGTSVHFIPLHLHPYWRDRYQLRPEDFPVALDTYRRCVSLPIYPRMSDEDVERVIETVRTVLVRHSK